MACPPLNSPFGIRMVGTAQERLCPPYGLKRANGEIAQPQIGVAAFFPQPEQRPVQRLPQQVVALAHGNADALAEIPALDEWAAAEGAALGGIGAVDPERQRDGVAENEIDLAAPQRLAERVVVRVGVQLGIGEQRLEIRLMRGAGDGADFLAFEIFRADLRHYGVAP